MGGCASSPCFPFASGQKQITIKTHVRRHKAVVQVLLGFQGAEGSPVRNQPSLKTLIFRLTGGLQQRHSSGGEGRPASEAAGTHSEPHHALPAQGGQGWSGGRTAGLAVSQLLEDGVALGAHGGVLTTRALGQKGWRVSGGGAPTHSTALAQGQGWVTTPRGGGGGAPRFPRKGQSG